MKFATIAALVAGVDACHRHHHHHHYPRHVKGDLPDHPVFTYAKDWIKGKKDEWNNCEVVNEND